MRVIRADVMGMCFGVRDALKRAEAVPDPTAVTVHGQLVHNEVVNNRLRERGFATGSEGSRGAVPSTSVVLVTAHGISERERRRLAGAGKALIDTTCPLVTRAHQAAQSLAAEGYHVLVVGRRGHVEVNGIVEDLPSFDVVESADDVRPYPFERLGIVCQTTSTERNVREVREAVASRNPGAEVRFLDTVCHPTKDHQRSLERLLGRVDGVVVVGGRNSNNTKELVALCRERSVAAWHVQGAPDLRPEWFDGVDTVGLTAGTSTLDETIDDVYSALTRMGAG